jgi:hypothetical protein
VWSFPAKKVRISLNTCRYHLPYSILWLTTHSETSRQVRRSISAIWKGEDLFSAGHGLSQSQARPSLSRTIRPGFRYQKARAVQSQAKATAFRPSRAVHITSSDARTEIVVLPIGLHTQIALCKRQSWSVSLASTTPQGLTTLTLEGFVVPFGHPGNAYSCLLLPHCASFTSFPSSDHWDPLLTHHILYHLLKPHLFYVFILTAHFSTT